ncbi:phosphoserine phosphatase SerB [Psychrobacter urativorans]|uniref:phosphoserine phosphatase SerB n=1 Tax=Psychrobacter urativorans TaxID=45610 RepID=UPI001D12C1D7|nr:phosphoserine phosphatase SerB [Psychrobacter urativorans]
MAKNTSYSLPKDSKAWQQAVNSIAELLPDDINLHDFDALQSLPLFALIVVLPVEVPTLDIHQYVQSWVDEQPNWHLVTVAEDKEASFVEVPIEHTMTSPAYVTAGVRIHSSNENNANSSKAEPHNPSDSSAAPNTTAKPAFVSAQVFRYLLVPVTDTLMHAGKKVAAAHMIDEQLTSRLRHDLAEHQLAQNNSHSANTSAKPRLDNADLVDCHILSIGHMLRTHKLACFDMDSTLIEQEVIVELAKTAGVGQQVATITEAAMRGEIDFDESFAQRVALLKGVPTSVLDEICARLSLSTGAHTTISALKALGYHTVLVSGGFTYFARYIAEQLGIDEVHANNLDISAGVVSGHVQLPIINGAKKAAIVAHTAERLGIAMSQVVCVGDGANDLPMMASADLGVAYRAKSIVQARADAAVNVTGLEGVLYALGYPAFIAKQS